MRGCEAAAGTSEENLGERGLFVVRPYLHLQEEAVRREEQPVQYRCGGLSVSQRWWWVTLFVQLVPASAILACAERTPNVTYQGRRYALEEPAKLLLARYGR